MQKIKAWNQSTMISLSWATNYFPGNERTGSGTRIQHERPEPYLQSRFFWKAHHRFNCHFGSWKTTLFTKILIDQDRRRSMDPRSGKSCSKFEGSFSQMLLVMQPSYEHWIYSLDSIQMGQTMWYHSHVIRWRWGLTRETGEVILNRCTHTGHLTVS